LRNGARELRPVPPAAPGLFRPEAEKHARDIRATFPSKGLLLFAKKRLLGFADQALLLFDFTAYVTLYVERAGRRRFNFWPLLLLFCSSIGFIVNGGILAVELARRLWHWTSPGGNIFALSIQDQQMLIWMVISGVGRLAASNLGSNNAAGTERTWAAKDITARRVFVVFRRLLLLAALGCGGWFYAAWLIDATPTAQANTVRVAWGILIAVAVYVFMKVAWAFTHVRTKVQREVKQALEGTANPKSSPAVNCPLNMEAWVALMGGGDYAQSWDAAAPYFQRALTKAEWVSRLEKVRQPLGEVRSRTLRSMKPSAAGTRWEAKYLTAFEGLPAAEETITYAETPNGEWRAIGHLIRPAQYGRRYSRWVSGLAAAIVIPLWIWVIFFRPSESATERDGQWRSQRMSLGRTSAQNPLASLQVTQVSRDGRIVVFDIVSEAGFPAHQITAGFVGAALKTLPPPEAGSDLTGLLVPNGWMAGGRTVMRGGNSGRGPGAFRFGFVMPDADKVKWLCSSHSNFIREQPC